MKFVHIFLYCFLFITLSISQTYAADQDPNQATIILQITDDSGTPISVSSGGIFVSNESGRDSDGFDLSKTSPQQCFTKLPTVGKYQCSKHADSWYGGMNVTPDGYVIVDGGIKQDEGDAPTPLTAGGSVTITIKLRKEGFTNPQPAAANPAFVPNCKGIQGPTTIQLGQSATYTASFSSTQPANLFGMINAVKTTNTTLANSESWDWKTWPPTPITDTSGTLSFTWKPSDAGIYQVFCRAWNGSTAECRGAANTVDIPPRYVCNDPTAVMSVNVTAADLTDTGTNPQDICQFATTIGGNSITPQSPVTLAAIAKPKVSIKNYSFSFYNEDNTKAKPIFFTAKTGYIINSPNNTITITYADVDKVDLQTGKRPTTVRVNANFTNTNNILSTSELNCTLSLQIQRPSQTTSQAPTSTQPISPSRGPGLLATLGVLLIAIIVALNFFFT